MDVDAFEETAHVSAGLQTETWQVLAKVYPQRRYVEIVQIEKR